MYISAWWKGIDPLPDDERITVLHNNSLRIVATKLEDTSDYVCVAENFMGSDIAGALISVKVKFIVHLKKTAW